MHVDLNNQRQLSSRRDVEDLALLENVAQKKKTTCEFAVLEPRARLGFVGKLYSPSDATLSTLLNQLQPPYTSCSSHDISDIRALYPRIYHCEIAFRLCTRLGQAIRIAMSPS